MKVPLTSEEPPESIATGVTGLNKSVTRNDGADETRSHECERCTHECARHKGDRSHWK